ncbi:MAG: hypothetical protein ACLQK4_06615 [Acidimicrobiales bacterium]|jgi:hypothetical protein
MSEADSAGRLRHHVVGRVTKPALATVIDSPAFGGSPGYAESTAYGSVTAG